MSRGWSSDTGKWTVSGLQYHVADRRYPDYVTSSRETADFLLGKSANALQHYSPGRGLTDAEAQQSMTMVEYAKYLTAMPEKIKVSPVTSDKTLREQYEEAYWKFVNAQTEEDALSWKNQMLSRVDLTLEPLPGYKGWVAEPEEPKAQHYMLRTVVSGFAMLMLTWILGAILYSFLLFAVG